MGQRVVIGVKVDPCEKARLAAEAATAGVTVSEWCRRILAQGFRRPGPPVEGVASHDEVLELLSQAARAGDVTAMRHLERALAPVKAPTVQIGPRSVLDELASRRQTRPTR